MDSFSDLTASFSSLCFAFDLLSYFAFASSFLFCDFGDDVLANLLTGILLGESVPIEELIETFLFFFEVSLDFDDYAPISFRVFNAGVYRF